MLAIAYTILNYMSTKRGGVRTPWTPPLDLPLGPMNQCAGCQSGCAARFLKESPRAAYREECEVYLNDMCWKYRGVLELTPKDGEKVLATS